MNLLTANNKMKKTSKALKVKVLNWTIPAYRSMSGKVTCPFADECVKFCYARKKFYTWSNVKQAHEARYIVSQSDGFVDLMNMEIARKKPQYVRVHDAGDYYSPTYLKKWLDIMRSNPHVRFYSYTNSVQMLLDADLPDNFDVIFSDSGKQKHLIDHAIHRHTRIFKSLDDLKNAGYVDASNFDLLATKWYSPNTYRIGLIAH